MESDKLNELNRQINEIKKRILLAGKFFKPQNYQSSNFEVNPYRGPEDGKCGRMAEAKSD